MEIDFWFIVHGFELFLNNLCLFSIQQFSLSVGIFPKVFCKHEFGFLQFPTQLHVFQVILIFSQRLCNPMRLLSVILGGAARPPKFIVSDGTGDAVEELETCPSSVSVTDPPASDARRTAQGVPWCAA